MKKLFTFLLLSIVFTMFSQVGINTASPDASSMLDITATDKGILIPRMTQSERTAIATPATSLLVYQTDADTGFWYYNGTAWVNLNSTSGEFKSIGGLVQNTTNTAADDFVFGSTSLADIIGTNDDNRMFFNKNKGAFRAGQVTGNQWNDTNVGNQSSALGINTVASGFGSTAMGNGSISSSAASTAMGYGTTASGTNSTAIGNNSVASGYVAIAMGHFATAPSYGEITLGTYATTYTPVGVTTFNPADRIFSIGNGISTTRSNAITIFKNGNFIAGSDNLNDATGTNDDNRLFFNKSKGAFRAGGVDSTQWDDANVGNFSTAMGQQTIASGINATAMGFQTIALQDHSTAMSYRTTASGWASTAMGTLTTASGAASVSMGQRTVASGNHAVVLGTENISPSYGELVIGNYATNYTVTDAAQVNPADRVFSVGNGTADTNRSNAMTIFKNGNFIVGSDNLNDIIGTDDDNRLFFNKSKAAFRAGQVAGTQWDDANVGVQSTAMGYSPIASGGGSISLGNQTIASGINSTALGNQTIASNSSSTAIGRRNTASGTSSTAMGNQTTASGNYSTTTGNLTTASGNYSTAVGTQTAASGIASTAMGYITTASGDRSAAMGTQTAASGYASTAMGLGTTASGDRSTAMGDNNTAPSYGEAVLGTFATTYTPISATTFDAADRIFSVGNGTNTTRSNAMTILKNGRVGLGTDTPTRGLLEINGVGLGQGTLSVIAHGNGSTALTSLTGGTYGASQYSIWASGNIAATQFHAYSDARIKKVMGVSNSTDDLHTLEKIEITNYKMADSLQLGNKPIKKVIAQQVEKVYPQAVANNLSEVIPNIYKVSQIKNGWIDLVADVKVTDQVKLLFDGSEKLVTVTEVSSKGFKVNTDTEGVVFVYGKEVHDFRAVDYEALSMLNISATQELLKRIKALEADKTNLSAKVQALEENQASINARLEQMEGFLLKTAAATPKLTINK